MDASADRIAELGKFIRSPLNAVAIAELPVARLPLELACRPAPEPDFDEHAVILGWPDGEDNKSARLSLQQQVAAAVDSIRSLEL